MTDQNPTKVLTIDPGLANMGWAYFVGDRRAGSGTVETSNKEALHDRLEKLTKTLPVGEVDRLVLEGCFGPAKTKLDYVIGALITCINHKQYIIVTPAKWKKLVCPKGTKETYGSKITKLVTKRFGLKPSTQHEADALGLGVWYLTHGRKEIA